MNKKVYIIQDMPNHDYSPLESFGDIVFIGKADINNRFQMLGTPRNRHTLGTLYQALEHFVGGEDFLVLDGNPVLFAVALHVLATAKKNVEILKWDNREREYVALTFEHDLHKELQRMQEKSVTR